MQLTIPKRHRKSLGVLVSLSPASMRSLISSLRGAFPAATLSELAGRLSETDLGLGYDSLFDLLEMLASLYRVRTVSQQSVKKFVDDFVAAAKNETDGPSPSPTGGWPRLKADLTQLFALDESLGLTAKASELVLENQRVLCPYNCRILTDLRPVFLKNGNEKPSAVIVQHALKIAFHEGDTTKEFFVSLDSIDISILQEMLERAVSKEASLRKLMKGAGVMVLGLSGEGEQ